VRRPLQLEDVKRTLLGHWGTTPGQNFIYAHLNRVIVKYDLDMIYIAGPGHGGPALVANTYLEGSYGEIYPQISSDEVGLQKLFKQFSFPGGIPSHVSPECPGSILHLNGYKIANPSVLARIGRDELELLLRGYGWQPYYVSGHEPGLMHEAMAAALQRSVEQIHNIQKAARGSAEVARPRWPMLVLDSPKGWTGPKYVDGKAVEGTFRAHQVPLSDPHSHPEHLQQLEEWLRSYRPQELFDERGRLQPELAALAPKGKRRRDYPGGARSLRSTTCSRPTSGARTTTASPTRTRASSITWSTRRQRWCACTCRRMRTACCR
jgi:xylulose-5-phosphate/fructose-6-phosphate phosphoketolase